MGSAPPSQTSVGDWPCCSPRGFPPPPPEHPPVAVPLGVCDFHGFGRFLSLQSPAAAGPVRLRQRASSAARRTSPAGLNLSPKGSHGEVRIIPSYPAQPFPAPPLSAGKGRVAGLPAKGWFSGNQGPEGAQAAWGWDGALGSAGTFPSAASSGKSMVCRWRRMRRIPSR